MATKRKSSGQASKRRGGAGKALPGWVWGLSGLAVGLFIAFLVHLEGSRPGTGEEDAIGALLAPSEEPATDGGGAGAGQPAAGDAEGDGPRFEFYKLLPEQEVEVPRDSETETAGDAAPTVPDPGEAAPAEDDQDGGGERANDGRYLLQTGSFRGFEDADRMKASLALLGVEARIQEVELTGGETWYRVRIGPYSDRDEINRIRERLAENEVDAILLRAGG